MTEAQRAVFDRLFEEASTLPESQRHAWLAARCSDPDIRAELESLLPYASATSGFTAAVAEVAALAQRPSLPAGHMIGPYRIVGILGEGGMGTVYEGIRDDDQFRQRVAIKILRMGVRSEPVRRRFLQERQILAELEHPNIARLFDGGTAPDGSPYLVMECIDGEPLTAFANSRKLSIRQRLELFRQVANAVQYAHQKLIVHRDLKPGNILVGADGVPKLLDFGIAKLLDVETAGGEALTVTGFRLMTPDYASPEQVEGKPVRVASDIYSLGALLYELLSGTRPHGLQSYHPAEIAERICLREVAPPSSAGGPALRGDLDTIVLKAMHKAPERRYNSAEQFSEDLRRYLEGMPVLARPDTTGYRMRKFAGRHWVGLGATAAVVVALSAGVAVSMDQARQAEAARRIAVTQKQAAEQERARAESEARVARSEQDRFARRVTQMVELANRSLYHVHSAIQRVPGATEARRQVVATTLQFLENLSQDAGQDHRLRLVLSVAYSKVAEVQGYPLQPNLGDTKGALENYRKSIALIEPLLAKEPDRPEYILQWLEAHRNSARVLALSGGEPRAVAVWRAILPAAQRLARLCPNDPRCHIMEGRVCSALVGTLETSDSRAALDYSRLAIQSLERAVKSFPKEIWIQIDLATAYSSEAGLLARRGQLREAVDLRGRAISQRESLLQHNPSDVLTRRTLMVAYGNLGSDLGSPWHPNLGDTAGAREAYGKALSLARELAKADANNQLAQSDLAWAMLLYASQDLPKEAWSESLALLRESEGILLKLIAADPQNHSTLTDLPIVQEYLGRRLEALGDRGAAMMAYRQSLATAEKGLGRSPSNFSLVRSALVAEEAIAELLAHEGDRAGALEMARKAVARAERSTAGKSERDRAARYVATAYRSLGSVQASLGNWTGARAAAERAVAGWRKLASENRYVDRAELERAEALLRECSAHLQ